MKQLVTGYLTLCLLTLSTAVNADPGYKVATVIKAAALESAKATAPNDRVSDQPLSHVESAEGRLGIGVVHRPVIKKGGPIQGIQHHKQSEVYRVMSGSGVLVTSTGMTDTTILDPDGRVVRKLTGPSDIGIIDSIENRQQISAGDVVIIPAGVAHGFSEITEAITYMVVRIDPERLVALK